MAKKILLVDDDSDFQSAVKIVLEKSGYQCIESRSAKQGLQLYSKEHPDLILLDVMMEDIGSGFRFAKKVRDMENRTAKAHTPILMVSSIQKLTDLDFAERLGTSLLPVDSFLDKPVETDMLLQKIRTMLA